MSESPASTAAAPLFLPSRWLISRRVDLAFLIGSAALSYALLALWKTGVLSGLHLMLLWIFAFHGPHFFATMSRTFLDREEWRERGDVLRRSLLWFLLGPACLLVALALQPWFGGDPRSNDLVMAFFAFAAWWAYHHVVKQHFGFMALYRARQREFDRKELFWHRRYIVASLWLPMVATILESPYWLAQVPALASRVAPRIGPERLFGWTQQAAVVALWAFWIVQALYVGSLVKRRLAGRSLNLQENLIVLASVPLHYVVARSVSGLSGFDAYAVVPLVTTFHNLQYHALVWSYSRSKYLAPGAPHPNAAPALLARWLPLYVLAGVAYTCATIGVEYFGLYDLAALGRERWLGQIVASAIWGWSFLHYYLDGKLWHVQSDANLRRVLGFETARA
ncbi:MAG: hypothetical protein EPO68_13030 [Planctomycetota bacterium]|nr:MAG: hypothetical protein EPO68_13030 [Planctomycetota bacterium]